MRPKATSVCGLKLLMYAALRYYCMRPDGTIVCGLKVLLCAASLLCLHARYGRDNPERQGSDGFGDRYSVSVFTSTNVQILTLVVLATDGVWDVLRNEEAMEVVMAARDSGRDASTAGTQSTQITSFTSAKVEAGGNGRKRQRQGREHSRCAQITSFTNTKVQILTPEELLAAKLLAEAAHATWCEYSGTQFSCYTGTKVKYPTCRGGAVAWREYSDISCHVLFFIFISHRLY